MRSAQVSVHRMIRPWGAGGEGERGERGPQSVQSVPYWQVVPYSEPGPPSSQSPSEA